ncbi:peptide chain release factor 1 [Fibrobacterota bacterium]
MEQARKAIQRREDIEAQIAEPEVIGDVSRYTALAKTLKSLEKVAEKSREYTDLHTEIQEWIEVSKDPSDPEMQQASERELIDLQKKSREMEEELKFLLIPKDPTDLKNVLLEIRAGTGGDEASIFTGDLFRMYRAFSESKGWSFNVISFTEGTMGGFKEIISEIEGDECYGILKYESGVHRVQRVPVTESQGRIHTSAATVAVMPEAEEVDVEIQDTDVRIDTYRSSGHGGQSVNTTDSAIRITHLPTGMVVTCQDEKSQLKNKDKAMKVLRSRLLDARIAEQQQERAAQRKSQVGSGDRSAKIRTYNYPQGRVTDHRINLSLYALDGIIRGDLQQLIEALAIEEMTEKLRELEQID